MKLYRRLLVLATLLAFGVVGLGAFVRLSDAGLGCPDWPGCYGHLVGVPSTLAEHADAGQSFPGKTVDTGKAWKEMVHRYCAAMLGLMIIALATLSWRLNISRRLATGLVAVVTGQALLGMWTVTQLLKPVVVTAHLLGGMTTLAILVAMLVRSKAVDARPARPARMDGLRVAAFVALVFLSIQIALGGWVSSNYAALVCPEFPTCGGDWVPDADYQGAFVLFRHLGMTADGNALSIAALTAIHWSHRIGALIVALVIGGLALALWRRPAWRGWAGLLFALLVLQIGLGILNVLLSLPLPLAVAHNLGAAMLLALTLSLNLRLSRPALCHPKGNLAFL
jgi:cytochrome c oxidase assembly protein subunit 15